MRRRRLHHLASAALIAVALACLWMAWTASGSIQGAYFTEDASAPSQAGDVHGSRITAAVVAWIVAAVVSAVAAAVIARRARRRRP